MYYCLYKKKTGQPLQFVYIIHNRTVDPNVESKEQNRRIALGPLSCTLYTYDFT